MLVEFDPQTEIPPSCRLVGGLEHLDYFPIYIYILGIIIPTDLYIFQRGRLNHQPDMFCDMLTEVLGLQMVVGRTGGCQS